jgi:hypothetical protein
MSEKRPDLLAFAECWNAAMHARNAVERIQLEVSVFDVGATNIGIVEHRVYAAPRTALRERVVAALVAIRDAERQGLALTLPSLASIESTAMITTTMGQLQAFMANFRNLAAHSIATATAWIANTIGLFERLGRARDRFGQLVRMAHETQTMQQNTYDSITRMFIDVLDYAREDAGTFALDLAFLSSPDFTVLYTTAFGNGLDALERAINRQLALMTETESTLRLRANQVEQIARMVIRRDRHDEEPQNRRGRDKEEPQDRGGSYLGSG